MISVLMAAKRAGKTPQTIRRWIYSGHVSGEMIGRDWFVDPDSLAKAKKNKLHPGRPVGSKDSKPRKKGAKP